MSSLKLIPTDLSTRGVNYCNFTRNVDDMFDLFDLHRKNIIKILIENPDQLTEVLWTETSPISIDRECLCQMGQHEIFNEKEFLSNMETPSINPIVRSKFSCPQCTSMGRLFKLCPSNLKKPIIIENGKRIGSNFFLKKINISLLKVELTDNPNHNLENLFSRKNNILVCEPSLAKLKSYRFLGSDQCTNQILMTWYLDHITSKINMNTINKMHNAFICGDDGYFFYELPSIGSLVNLTSNKKYLKYINQTTDKLILKPNITYELLLQLFSTLDFLKKYDFTHGNIDENSIMFDEKFISYSYDGVKISSEIGIKLYDFSGGGININSETRIYNKSEIAENQFDMNPFDPLVKTINLIPYIENMDDYDLKKQSYAVYKLTKSTSYRKYQILFLYLQHMGFPLYQSSFGAYSYMILLMSNSIFYDSIISNEKLNYIWQLMWIPEEFDSVNEKIKKYHNGMNEVNGMNEMNSMDSIKIIEFLSPFHLRCDCIEIVWNNLKLISSSNI